MAFSTALYANDRQRSLLYAAGQPSIRPRKHISVERKINRGGHQKSLLRCRRLFADILSGTGLWATFLSHHRSLYGRILPFFPAENYYDGEVNREDLRVLLWYLLCTHDSLHEILSPLDDRLVATADTIYDLLESEYETAPDSPLLQEFCLPELNDTDDPEARYRFAEWLFWDSFLLGPSNRSLARQLSHEAQSKSHGDKERIAKLGELRRESLYTLPAGPLALFAHEWVSLLWQHTFPEEAEEKKELHPYYRQFTREPEACLSNT